MISTASRGWGVGGVVESKYLEEVQVVGIVEQLWGRWLNHGDASIDVCRVAGGNGG